jgi:hypothetical protein
MTSVPIWICPWQVIRHWVFLLLFYFFLKYHQNTTTKIDLDNCNSFSMLTSFNKYIFLYKPWIGSTRVLFMMPKISVEKHWNIPRNSLTGISSYLRESWVIQYSSYLSFPYFPNSAQQWPLQQQNDAFVCFSVSSSSFTSQPQPQMTQFQRRVQNSSTQAYS